MKKITSYILCLFAGSLVTSCDLEAPAKSSLSEDLIFSSEGLADAAVMAIHQSFAQTNSYRGRFIPYLELIQTAKSITITPITQRIHIQTRKFLWLVIQQVPTTLI